MTSLPRQIAPISRPLRARVRVPGSKSLTNRALLLAALSTGTTTLADALFSDDSCYLAEALKELGFRMKPDKNRSEITLTGEGGTIPARMADLFIGNAGTAARFLTAFLTVGSGMYTVDGDARMRERPMQDLVESLTVLGASLQTANGKLPLKVVANGLRGGRTIVAGDISSQFLSALLMVAPCARNPVEIILSTEINSRPYVDMTLSVMHDFGVEIERQEYERFQIRPAAYRSVSTYRIEPDASAASYFFAAPAVCGGSVRVENLSRKSAQGDLQFADVLEQMGCRVLEGNDFIEVSGPDTLKGVDVDMRDIPDTAQTLAAIAPFACSPTRIRGIASARFKETDRIHATCTELDRLGVHVEEHEDGMTIHPCRGVTSAAIQTYHDHRMAMAFSLIGLRAPGISIENPSCVSKTFPNFFEVLESLR